MRFIKALIREVRAEVSHQLWMSKNNLHPDYFDFGEFLQDAGCYQRELWNTIKIESMSEDEWLKYRYSHFTDYRD